MLNHFSPAGIFATPWIVVCQTPLFMGFSRQEDWNGLSFPSPGDLCNPGIEPGSPAFTGSLPSEPAEKPECSVWDKCEGAHY